mmetsp:Transcript_33285/g.100318  ORF Transcript_33285/g.100318 Transcript_33285/m.100318 type:complete len:113 (+) Transcript_33285:178-516(+)
MSVCDTDFDSTRASRASSDSDSEPKPDVDASDGPLEVARPRPTRLRRAKKLLAGAWKKLRATIASLEDQARGIHEERRQQRLQELAEARVQARRGPVVYHKMGRISPFGLDA